jgi:arylsulfatase A-like enzyme
VPTIVSWPGTLPAGKVNDNPIITMDWIPTILDFMGENPEQEGLEGMSLKETLLNPEEEVERDLFWHFPHYRLNDIVPYAIVRSGDYKLIHYFDGSQDELYNLDFDMEEKVNVISTRKAIADQLLIKLEKWLKDTEARLPVEK